MPPIFAHPQNQHISDKNAILNKTHFRKNHIHESIAMPVLQGDGDERT